MFGLSVRFTCKDEAAAEAYDKLVAETIEAIKATSRGRWCTPPTWSRASRCSESSMSCTGTGRRSRRTRRPRTPAATWRQRDQYLASTEVDWLTLQTGKGTGG